MAAVVTLTAVTGTGDATASGATVVCGVFVVSVVIGAAMISTVVILLSSSYVIIGFIIGMYFYHCGVCCKASCVFLVMYLTAVFAQDDKGRVSGHCQVLVF